MPQSALIGALLAGLLGGLHCVAMCGGYVGALSGLASGPQALVRSGTLRLGQLAAHAGRLTTYTAMGILLGATGGAALAASWGTAQRVLYAVANVLLLVLAVSVARGGLAAPSLERAGLAVFSRMMPAIPRLARRSGVAARYGLGLLWGLTPCGLVYGVLPVALMSGSAVGGGLVMLAFGVGTLPNLLAAGWLLGKARPWLTARPARVVGALIIGAFAAIGLWRAMFMPAALAHGPFCVVP